MTMAIWCVLIAALLPIVSTGISKALGGAYDNNDPRGRALSYQGRAKRAHAAHLNGYESFPFFAAAVLLAEMKGGTGGTVGILALVHVGTRIGYIAAYIGDKATLRSFLWGASLFATIAIFTAPAWR